LVKLKQRGNIEWVINENNLYDAIEKIESVNYKGFMFNNVSLINSIKADIDIL